MNIGTTLPKFWPNYGKIEFQQVYLKYSEDEAPVLKNLNFTVKSGEKVKKEVTNLFILYYLDNIFRLGLLAVLEQVNLL